MLCQLMTTIPVKANMSFMKQRKSLDSAASLVYYSGVLEFRRCGFCLKSAEIAVGLFVHGVLLGIAC